MYLLESLLGQERSFEYGGDGVDNVVVKESV